MAEMEASGIKPVTVKGTRFLELESGRESGTVAKEGDAVEVHYKVLKLGKRSYDGLSGEGTVRVLVCFLISCWCIVVLFLRISMIVPWYHNVLFIGCIFKRIRTRRR